MNKQQYQPNEVTDAAEQARLLKERGLSVKKTNFHFGSDGLGSSAWGNIPSGAKGVSPVVQAGTAIGG